MRRRFSALSPAGISSSGIGHDMAGGFIELRLRLMPIMADTVLPIFGAAPSDVDLWSPGRRDDLRSAEDGRAVLCNEGRGLLKLPVGTRDIERGTVDIDEFIDKVLPAADGPSGVAPLSTIIVPRRASYSICAISGSISSSNEYLTC